MIYRVKKTGNYFLQARDAYNDKRLSYKALGIYGQLMSRPDGWEINEEYLAGAHSDGRASVRSGVAELIRYGYMVRIMYRYNGKIVDWRCDLFEVPALNPYYDPTLETQPDHIVINLEHEDQVKSLPHLAPAPDSDFLNLDFPDVEKRTHNNNRIIVNNEKKEAQTGASAPQADKPPVAPSSVPVEAKEKQKKEEAKTEREPSQTTLIRDAYIEALQGWEGNPVFNWGELGSWAKKIAQAGYAPADVTYTVHFLKKKADGFWAGQHLSLAAVAKQIGAVVAQRDGKIKAAQSAPSPNGILSRIAEL